MNRFFLCVFALLFVYVSSAQEWRKIDTPPIGGLLDMHFMDANNGILTGYGDAMIITHDGGLTWTKIDVALGINETIPNLHMVNMDTGYAISSNGILIKTSNGGYTWHQLNSGTDKAVRGLFFINEDLGFYCGQGQMIAKTANGGNSWNIQEYGPYWLRDIYFPTPDTGYSVGDDGNILKSTDQGNTWYIIKSGPGNNQRCVNFISKDTGYVCGQNGHMIKTTDGGNTWIQLNLETTEELTHMYFFNTMEGYVVGDHGLVKHTYDGGLEWIDESIPTDYKLFRIYFADDTTAYICGYGDEFYKNCNPPEAGFYINHISNMEYSFQDTSIRANSYYWDFGDGYYSDLQNPTHIYSDTGSYNVCLTVTGCSTDSCCQNLPVYSTSISEKPAKDRFTIFPNPCTGVFSLKIEDGQNDIIIDVFDPIGNLTSTFQTRDSKTMNVDLTNSPKGMYLLRIRTDDWVVSKKLIYY